MTRFVASAILMLGTLAAFGEPPEKKAEPEHKKLDIYAMKPPKAAVGDTELRKLDDRAIRHGAGGR